MLQKEKKDNSILSLALLLALVTTPMAATFAVSDSTIARSSSDDKSFALPQSVPNGTLVRIDGSSTLAAINQSLKQGFKKQFSGVKVEVASNGTDAALKALRDGTIDLAAIGRGLTPDEEAQGLEQIRLRREKIAIVVGKDNPFQGSLTSKQFAQIFRGEITDWSLVGGSPGKIRFIDRPTNSDTRLAFRTYPVFEEANFATVSTATQLTEDSTSELVKQLGKDGIGYAIANQVSKLPGVHLIQISNTLPDDSRYPFSQPLVFVYKKNPNLGVSSFLGFVTASLGQQAIEEARTAEKTAIASSVSGTTAQAQSTSSTPTSTTTASPGVVTPATTTPNSNTNKATASNKNASFLNFNSKNLTIKELTPILMWVLPLFALGGLLLWWLLGRRSRDRKTEVLASSPGMPMQEMSTGTFDVSVPLAIGKAHSQSSDLVENPIQKISDPVPNINQSASNQQTNLAAGGATVATAAATPLWLRFHNRKSDTIVADETTPLSNADAPQTARDISSPSQPTDPEGFASERFAQEKFELEAPAAVVSNLYPKLPTVDEGGSNVSPVTEATSPQGSNVTKITSNAPVVIINSSPKPDVPAASTQVEAPVVVNTHKGDAAIGTHVGHRVPPVDSTQAVPTESNNEDITSGNAALLGGTPLAVGINGSFLSRFSTKKSDIKPSNEVVADVQQNDQPAISSAALDRVADAAESTAESEETQEITQVNQPEVVEAASPNLMTGLMPIPQSHVELPTNSPEAAPVVNEATSQPTRIIESSIVLTPRTLKWAYAAWNISPAQKEALQPGGSQLTLRLYDVTNIDLSYQTPQLVQQYECEETIHNRFVAIPAGDRNYIAEIGYLTKDNRWLPAARSPIVRIFSRPEKDFYFVADAELIIHGATEPGSTVSVGGYPIKIKSDGTFHLRIPFTDSLIDYLMTATAANEEQTKTIRMNFSQNKPEE